MNVSVRTPVPLGCLAVFLIPFFGFAALAIFWGVRELTRGNKDGLFLVGFGVVFGGFAAMFSAVARRATRQAADHQARHQQFAAEPWKVRDDWAAGRILANERGALVMSWLFAVVWNAISCPILFVIPRELAKGKPEILIGLLFPAVGLGLLTWAIRATIRARKFGVSALELQTIPGAVGGVLAGVLRLERPLDARDGVRLRLSCLQRITTGSGKNRSTREHVRWQDEQVIRKTHDVPVFFRIPAAVSATDSTNPANAILWRVDADAATPGVDYHARFEVPVFAVAQPNAPSDESLARYRDNPVAFQPSPASRIRLNRFAPGGPEFVFPPARNPGALLTLGGFLALWTGALWLTISKGAPLIFLIAFGIIEVFLILAWGHMLLWGTRVVVTPGGLRLQRGLPGLQTTRLIPRSEIAGLKLAGGMQVGPTLCHDLRVERTDGKTVTLASALPDKREADWLVDQLRVALGDQDRARGRSSQR